MKEIKKNYERINDKVIRKLGHEHPVTINVLRASENVCDIIERNPGMAYAHLVEEKTGKKVSKMHLYYTGEENGVPTVTFDKSTELIDKTIKEEMEEE